MRYDCKPLKQTIETDLQYDSMHRLTMEDGVLYCTTERIPHELPWEAASERYCDMLVNEYDMVIANLPIEPMTFTDLLNGSFLYNDNLGKPKWMEDEEEIDVIRDIYGGANNFMEFQHAKVAAMITDKDLKRGRGLPANNTTTLGNQEKEVQQHG